MTPEILNKIKDIEVLVVGDVMLDRYWYGEVERISPEAPVPIVGVNRDGIKEQPGGAANVARNVTALGAHCTLLGIVGGDHDAKELERRLKKDNVECNFVAIDAIDTIVKLRVISQNQQLIRLDFESPISSEHSEKLQKKLAECIRKQKPKVVIFSDYGKGSLLAIPAMIKQAKEAGIVSIVDPKGDDYTIYTNATMITPNRKEFEQVVGRFSNDDELIGKASKLIKSLNLESMLVTRGSEGMNWIFPDDLSKSKLHGTKAREVYDVTGAGDTVIATIGAGTAAGIDFDNLIQLALYTAGIVVGKLGSAVALPDEIIQAYSNDGV